MLVKSINYQALENTLYTLLEELENGSEFYENHPGFNISVTCAKDWYKISDRLLTDQMKSELGRYFVLK